MLTVSDKEKENLKKYLPSVSDTESAWEGKATAIKSYY
jgi:hypothetical protein